MVSELIGIYKELNFEHELKAQLPESYVKRLPARLCARLGERVSGKARTVFMRRICELVREKQDSTKENSEGCHRSERKKNLWQIVGVQDMKDDRSKLGMFEGVESNGLTNEKPIICTVKKCPVH